jgi:site-specific DNA-methyltransferase (adenine-specific)
MKTKITIGNATMYLGDTFDILPKLKKKFDAVISDPPYGSTNCKWDVKIPLDKLWEILDQRTKQTASFVLFGCGRFTYELYNSKCKWYRYDMIWQKSKKCGHLNSRLMPMRNHEQILVFARPGFKTKTTYNAQRTPGGRVGVKTVNHKSSVYRATGKHVHVADGYLEPPSVLHFKSEFGGHHSTQKPLGLMQYLVETYSNDGDTVLDCFMGSGSTGIAAIKTGRRFIGIEQSEEYFTVAVKRLRETYKELSKG